MGVDRIWTTSAISVRVGSDIVYRTNNLCHSKQQTERIWSTIYLWKGDNRERNRKNYTEKGMY